MKKRGLLFRQKLILISMLLLIFGTDLLGVLFIRSAKSIILEREAQAAYTEASVIASHLVEDLNSAVAWGVQLEEGKYQSILENYKKIYEGQGVSLTLHQNMGEGQALLGALLEIRVPLAEPYNLWTMEYVRDMTPYLEMLDQCMDSFCKMSLVIGVCMAVAIAYFMRRLTQPLEKIVHATQQIENGNYAVRLSADSKDELGDLSERFNIMSSAIEAKLQETQRLAADKQQLVDQLAHELRTPLTSILGFSEYVLHGNCTEAERTTALTHIYQQAARMKKMSQHLLEHEKVNEQMINCEKLKTIVFFDELKGNWDAIEQREQVTVQVDCACEEIYGDSMWLQNLLINLVENAARASEKDDTVIVAVRDRQNEILISVEDHGCGISETDLPHIFEPFYRGDRQKARKAGGNGLGLSLCQAIVDAHHGRIEVESYMDHGTKISVFLRKDNNFQTT